MRITTKSVAALSLLAVVLLWWHGRDGAPAGNAAWGRLAGLTGTDLLLLQVQLMVRIPWVERAYGQDKLARWHRWTGDEGAIIGLERFGASAPGEVVLQNLGFTPEHVASAALRVLGQRLVVDVANAA